MMQRCCGLAQELYLSVALVIGLLFSPFSTGFTADTTTLTLGIEGTVGQHCSLSSISNSLIKLTMGEEKKINFKVNCNTPFRYSLKSLNGGLKHQETVQNLNAAGKFPAIASYDISVNIPLEQGNKESIADQCSSTSMHGAEASCRFSDSGTSISIDTHGFIGLTPEKIDLLAGNYTDTLVLEVTVN